MSQLEILEESVSIVLSDSIVWSFLACFRFFMVVSKLYLQFWGCRPLIWSKTLPLFSMDSYIFLPYFKCCFFSPTCWCSIENPRPFAFTKLMASMATPNASTAFPSRNEKNCYEAQSTCCGNGKPTLKALVRCHAWGMPNVINYLRIAVPGANYQLLGICIILYHLFGQMILFQFPTCPRFMWRWPNELGIDQNGYPPVN